MEWSERGRIISVRSYGETGAIVDLLTPSRGRHPGLVRGGRSRAMRPVLQAGNAVTATWRARLEDHLGNYTLEPDELIAGALMDDPLALAGLNSACALAVCALPEREAHPRTAEAFEVLIEALQDPDIWPAVYIRWELGLLADLGYGVDTTRCAVTGETQGLAYVSPRSGRAVTAEAGEPYKDKLLRLPGFLSGSGEVGEGDLEAGLALSGYFLERRVLWPADRQLPEARLRLVEKLQAR